jgi:elongation factor P
MDISEVKKGMHVIIDGDLYKVIDFLHVKPGKGSAIMKTKIKNVRTGTTLERNFNTNYKCEAAMINHINAQYLYNDGSTYYFADMNTFEQIEVSAAQIGDDKDYFLENLEVQVDMLDKEILGVTIPEKLTMTVTKFDPTRETSSELAAITETGLMVRVPKFITQGEKIIVTTADGKYFSRAN